MNSTYTRPPGSGPQPTYRASPVSRLDWERRDPHGFIRMAIVFVGAFVGAFVLWPMPAFVADNRPHHADEARGYAAPAPSVGNRGRRQ